MYPSTENPAIRKPSAIPPQPENAVSTVGAPLPAAATARLATEAGSLTGVARRARLLPLDRFRGAAYVPSRFAASNAERAVRTARATGGFGYALSSSHAETTADETPARRANWN
ncbi:hypothetical protein GCM10020255_093700 [Rhodococcus baikonurensis]